MDPAVNDNGHWFDAAIGIVATLWAALGVVYWRLWNTLATREWVLKEMDHHSREDAANDRQLFGDLVSQHTGKIEARVGVVEAEILVLKTEIAQRHAENLTKLDKILETVQGLWTQNARR